jgi:hypothetical protein
MDADMHSTWICGYLTEDNIGSSKWDSAEGMTTATVSSTTTTTLTAMTTTWTTRIMTMVKMLLLIMTTIQWQ